MSEPQGWRSLCVARRVQETPDVVSLHLVSADDRPLASFQPGQFLTVRLKDDTGRAFPRNYSLSGDPGDLTQYRVTVRRHEHGIGSGRMHALAEGDVLEATGPKGRFVLDQSSSRPVILLAGGIGITPLTAMAHALARSGREATLFHAVREAAHRPLAAELDGLAKRAGNIRVVPVLTAQDGRIDAALLRQHLPIGDYEVYLCGPGDFMQAMATMLVGLGVRPDRIAYEFFGSAKPLDLTGSAPASVVVPSTRIVSDNGAPLVTFRSTSKTVPWDGSARTLLDFAEAQGLTPAFSCRNGICNTCLCKVEGAVRYIEEPLEEPAPGQALLCCCVPAGPVTLDI